MNIYVQLDMYLSLKWRVVRELPRQRGWGIKKIVTIYQIKLNTETL